MINEPLACSSPCDQQRELFAQSSPPMAAVSGLIYREPRNTSSLHTPGLEVTTVELKVPASHQLVATPGTGDVLGLVVLQSSISRDWRGYAGRWSNRSWRHSVDEDSWDMMRIVVSS